MNYKKLKLTASILALSLTVSMFAGCGKEVSNDTPNPNDPVQQESNGIPEDGGDFVTFKPSDLGMLPQEKYEFPYIGMNAVFSKAILEKLDTKDVIMLTSEDYNEDNTIRYAAMQLYTLTEEQKNETATAFNPDAWKAGLGQLGVLGVYHSNAIGELDTLTGCTQHKELGKSSDGTYTYYLSTADNADETLKNELAKTEITLTEMEKLDFFMGKTAFSEGRSNSANVGNFQTTDINGKKFTIDDFTKYDLTLVNVFTTWCSPCVQEMPELEKFQKEMNAKGVNVVGIVYDTINDSGKTDKSVIETAKQLQKKAKLTFPLLIPDETQMNGRLKGIDGYPESFFVDRNGNIVGETYVGAHTFKQWKEIAEKELANLKGAN